MHSLLARLRSLWRNLVHRSRVEREIDEELRAAYELLTAEQLSAGVTRDAARRAARIALGRHEALQDQVREVRAGAGIETLWHDVRFGMRVLRRSPSFTAAAIISVGLGIGANSAVFGLLNALRLRTLPVAGPQELAEIRLDGPRCCRHTGRNRQLSVPLWREIIARQQAFSAIPVFSDTRFNLAPQGEVQYVEGLYVSGDFFHVLGVTPHLGRMLAPSDDPPACTNAAAVISYALWQSEFGGRDDVLTRSITLRTSRHPIVGVMPRGFFGMEVGRRADVVLPLCASGFGRPDHWWLAAVGRLKSGWTSEMAQAHLATLSQSLLGAVVPPNYGAEQAREFTGLQLSVRAAANGVSPLRAVYEKPLWLLLAIAALVLATACANLASLSLARASARREELALRLALGASRMRVLRQLTVEGMLIATAGAVAALVLARVVHESILTLLSTQVDPIRLDLGLDWRSIAFTTAAIGVTAVAFTLAPLLTLFRRVSPGTSSARTTGDTRRLVLREILLGLQVAMAVVLVCGAMLFVLTSRNLLSNDPGFNPEGLVSVNVFLLEEHHPAAARSTVQRELTSRMAAIPGIAGVAQATTPPLGGSIWGTVVRAQQRDRAITREVTRNQIGHGYFGVMEMRLLAGRDFNATDTVTSPKVAVVNEDFARQIFDDARPLDRRFIDGADEFQIVGIVANSRQYLLREDSRPIVYTAASQVKDAPLTMRFVVRSRVAGRQTLEALREVVAAVAPRAGIRFGTYEEMFVASIQRELLMAGLSTFFGIIALTLAIVGVYGIVAYSAASRRREIGIRLALGADAAHVIRTVVGRTAMVAGAGLIAGIALTLAVVSATTAFLYDVDPREPGVFASMVAIIVLAAVLAAAVPARRALRTDPVIALKTE